MGGKRVLAAARTQPHRRGVKGNDGGAQLEFQEWLFGALRLIGVTDPLAMSVALGVIAAAGLLSVFVFVVRVVQILFAIFIYPR